MIEQISLTNFKCYKEKVAFPTARINVLYGMNGRGKSTLLQSLLLFSQTLKDKNNISKLQLKGNLLNVGGFSDVLNRYANCETFCIEFKEQEEVLEAYYGKDANPTIANLTGLVVNGTNYFDVHSTKSSAGVATNKVEERKTLGVIDKSNIRLLNTLEHLEYITAERIGPKEFAERKSIDSKELGIKGENSFQVIETQGGDFIARIQEELNYILGGASIRVATSEDKSIIQLYLDSVNNTHGFKPINVGFGYSYVLPIVVSVLLADTHNVIIIENPEAHLHPAAQSRIAQFLLKYAKLKNLQIFLETHSDHVINGIRIAVKEGKIDRSDVSILHFERSCNEQAAPRFKQIKVDCNGNLSSYPDDFMDEWTKQMLELA